MNTKAISGCAAATFDFYNNNNKSTQISWQTIYNGNCFERTAFPHGQKEKKPYKKKKPT